ncbi:MULTISPECIES: hypothetical protein [Serratia]|uniref:hypothetical protein n=1 Tax=Serratia TaxID=613 RepID=UPI00313B1FB9
MLSYVDSLKASLRGSFVKFEFGDLYKFIVSLGVVLAMSAFIIPWLFLREPFDIFKSTQDIAKLTALSQSIIREREGVVFFVSKHLICYSMFSFISGVALSVYGLYKWWGNQLIIDERTKIDLKIIKAANRDATEDEIEEKVILDIASQNSEVTRHVTNGFVSSYRQMELSVFERFSKYYSSAYDLSRDRMVADVNIDILMKGKGFFSKDWIIEVKYIKKGFNLGWLRQVLLKNLYAKNIYSQFENRTPYTLALIVVEDEAYVKNKGKYDELLGVVSNDGRKGKDIVVIVNKSSFFNAGEKEFKEIVKI